MEKSSPKRAIFRAGLLAKFLNMFLVAHYILCFWLMQVKNNWPDNWLNMHQVSRESFLHSDVEMICWS